MQSRGGAQKAKDELNNILLHGQDLKLGWGKAVVIPAVPLYSASGAPAAKGEQSRTGMHGCVGNWDPPKKIGRVHACHAADWAADHSMALLGYEGGTAQPRGSAEGPSPRSSTAKACHRCEMKWRLLWYRCGAAAASGLGEEAQPAVVHIDICIYKRKLISVLWVLPPVGAAVPPPGVEAALPWSDPHAAPERRGMEEHHGMVPHSLYNFTLHLLRC